MVLPLNRSSILFQSSAALSAVAKVFAFSVEELADGVGLKQMRGAELVGHKADVCEVLQRLHLQESVEESVSVGDDAVVRHEDRGVAGDERAETGGNLVGACGAVRSKRNSAEGHDGLRAQRLVEGAASAGEGGRDGRMSMNHGMHIVSHLIDGKVHTYFAGDLPGAGYLIAFEVDGDEVGGL